MKVSELFEAVNVKEWHFNRKGQDGNGNGGPSKRSRGWVTVTGKNSEEAANSLPSEDLAYLKSKYKKSLKTLDRYVDDTSGMGIGFSWVNSDNWADYE